MQNETFIFSFPMISICFMLLDITWLNLWQDDAVTEAGNTVSFVFRTKTSGQDTTQLRSWCIEGLWLGNYFFYQNQIRYVVKNMNIQCSAICLSFRSKVNKKVNHDFCMLPIPRLKLLSHSKSSLYYESSSSSSSSSGKTLFIHGINSYNMLFHRAMSKLIN